MQTITFIVPLFLFRRLASIQHLNLTLPGDALCSA
jgi:hypothetical protein